MNELNAIMGVQFEKRCLKIFQLEIIKNISFAETLQKTPSRNTPEPCNADHDFCSNIAYS